MDSFSIALKARRQQRRFSQLQLARRANVSPRHMSFLETGRAAPSREMVHKLGDALGLSLSARNQLLKKAGFADRFPDTQWTSKELAPVRSAVDRLLKAHDPYPGLAIDGSCCVLSINVSAAQLFAPFGISCGVSLVDRASQDMFQAQIDNWHEFGYHLSVNLRQTSEFASDPAEQNEPLECLKALSCPRASESDPVVPMRFKYRGRAVSLFSMVSKFQTPGTPVLERMKVQLFFPSDGSTKQFLEGSSAV